MELRNLPEKLQAIWCRFREVSYKAKTVTDSLIVEDVLDCSPMIFATFKDEIELIKMEVMEIDDNKVGLNAQKVFNISIDHVPL